MDHIDGERVVLILDERNRRVVLWTKGADEGVLLADLGFLSSAFTLDADGGLLVASDDSVMRWGPGESDGVVIAGGNGLGNAPDQLCMPTAILRDHDKSLLILNGGPDSDSIVRWAPGATVGEVVAGGNGRAGSFYDGIFGLNQLHAATSMALDPDGSIVVADANAARVVKWSPGADEAVIIAPAAANVNKSTLSGIRGTSLDKLGRPEAVTFDDNQSLIIVDEQNHRVLRWAVGDSAGVVVAGGNGRGSLLSQMAFPSHAAVDKDGSIVVADTLNDRVVRWVPGASEGVLVAGGNNQGSELNQLERGSNRVVLGIWKAWSQNTHGLFPPESQHLVRFLLLCFCRATRGGFANLSIVLCKEVLPFVVPARLAPSWQAGIDVPS